MSTPAEEPRRGLSEWGGRWWLLVVAGVVIAVLGAAGVFILASDGSDEVGEQVGPDTPLVIGQGIEVRDGAGYRAATIVALPEDGRVRVHYVGGEPRQDETVARTRLRLP